ncbi:MAG: hypothetical protein ACTHJQ_01470 [Rhizobiaceae bacterium]
MSASTIVYWTAIIGSGLLIGWHSKSYPVLLVASAVAGSVIYLIGKAAGAI